MSVVIPQSDVENLIPSIASRAVAPKFLSDGVTANRRFYAPMRALAGKTITIPIEVNVPVTNPSVVIFLFGLQSENTLGSTANGLRGYINTDGSLAVLEDGTPSGSNQRLFTYPGFRAAYSGETVRGLLTLYGNSTTNPVFKVAKDGDISSRFTASTAGTPPNWMPLDLNSSYFVAGQNASAGPFRIWSPILGTLTAAEERAFFETGEMPTWWHLSTGKPGAYVSDFSAGVDSWLGNATTPSGNIDGVLGLDDCLRAYASSASSAHSVWRSYIFSPGRRYGIRAKVYIPASNTNVNSASFFFGGEGASATTWERVSGISGLSVPGSWVDLEYVAEPKKTYSQLSAHLLKSGEPIYVGAGVDTDDLVYLKDVIIDDLGPLAKWDVPPAGTSTVYDAGTNNLTGTLTAGMSTTALYPSANVAKSLILTDGSLTSVTRNTPSTGVFETTTTITTSPRGVMSSQYNNGTEGARFHMRKGRGTRAAPAVITTGDMLGRVVASGYDGANYLEMGAIEIQSTGTIASTRIPTKINFYTATDAAPSVLTLAGTFDKDQSFKLNATVTATAVNTGTFKTANFGFSGNAGGASFHQGPFLDGGTFAEIYCAGASATQSIPTGTTYTKFTLFTTNGESNDCTADAANDKITITRAGRYCINGSFSSYVDTANTLIDTTIFLDGTEVTKIHSQKHIQVASETVPSSLTGIIDVTTVPVDLDVRVKHNQAGSVVVTTVYANLNVTFVGNT